MKNLTYVTAIIFLVISCAPKYGAHFQRTSSNSYKTEKTKKASTTEMVTLDKETQSVGEDWTNVTASIDDKIVETPIAEIIKKHNKKLEEIKLENISTKEADQKIKASKKELRKEVKAELKKEAKKAKKAGDGDYTLMMILGILIAPLGVGLTYDIGTEFWISLVLFLLFWLPGAIYGGIKVHQFYRG